MPSVKRRRSTAGPSVYAKRAKTVRANRILAYRAMSRNVGRSVYGPVRRAIAGVQRLNRMIETKEGCYKTGVNVAYAHNRVSQIALLSTNNTNNPFCRQNAPDDPMGAGILRMIGDNITVKGMKATFFIENALARPKVYYRIMLLKGPRGADFTNIFKGITGNLMIDQMNTEKYTVIASKRFNVTPSNFQANGVNAGGEPLQIPSITGDTLAGTASKIVNFWVPGRKFGRGGNLQYENGSNELKFFDYRWVICVYDWYGTPSLPGPVYNNVGRINEGYVKIYFKDA